MKDEELYKGFTPEQAQRYRREAAQSYGEERVQAAEERIRGWGSEKWEAVKAEMGAAAQAIAALMDRGPGDPEVQAQVARHHAVIQQFYPAPAEFMRAGMEYYIQHHRLD